MLKNGVVDSPWLCGGHTSSSNVRSHSKLNPEVCGGYMYKKLSGAAGMTRFQVRMAATHTNQNIRQVWIVKDIMDTFLGNTLHV